jgi:hypothetical protein
MVTMRARALLLTLPLLAACADPPASAVYVGTATAADAASEDAEKTFLVAFVMEGDRLTFFMCGDEPTDTTSAWADATEVVATSDGTTFETGGERGRGYWPGDGEITGGLARGTLVDNTDPLRVFHWNAEQVEGDSPNGPGLYSDGEVCETGVIVGPSEMDWSGPRKFGKPVLGSGCTQNAEANWREQVTPMHEIDKGYLVKLPEREAEFEVTRVSAFQ